MKLNDDMVAVLGLQGIDLMKDMGDIDNNFLGVPQMLKKQERSIAFILRYATILEKKICNTR